MTFRIIAVGKKHQDWIELGINRFTQRLKPPYTVEWLFLPHSAQTGDNARQDESDRILSRLQATEIVILLDETGKLVDSPALSAKFESLLNRGKPISIIIGGAYGVDAALKQRADFIWSLSPLVFPHQLVRLILTEQLYRAQSISSNHPYHHA